MDVILLSLTCHIPGILLETLCVRLPHAHSITSMKECSSNVLEMLFVGQEICRAIHPCTDATSLSSRRHSWSMRNRQAWRRCFPPREWPASVAAVSIAEQEIRHAQRSHFPPRKCREVVFATSFIKHGKSSSVTPLLPLTWMRRGCSRGVHVG